jgi:hypothetical protein
VSGLLVAAGGPGVVFAIDAVTYVFSIVTLALLRVPKAVTAAVRESFLSELAHGWREVRSRDWLIASLVVFGLSNMAMGSFMVLGPVIFEAELGGAAAWGLVMTAGAVGALLGGAVALRWTPLRPLAVGFALMLIGASRALSLIPPLPVVIIAVSALATAIAIQISNTLWETVLQQRIPQASLSRVSSYDWMVSLAFQPVAFVIIGPLADTIGNVPTLLLSAAIGLATNLAALMVPSIRNMRRLETDDVLEPGGELSRPVSSGTPVP